MSKIGLVAGNKKITGILKEKLENTGIYEVTYTPLTMNQLNKDLLSSGIHINELDTILIIDYAFTGGKDNLEEKAAQEFIGIQDLMELNMLNTPLHLLTRNTDLYTKLKGDLNGLSGTLYRNVHINILKDGEGYKLAYIKEVLDGKWDFKGLYNKDYVDNKNKETRLIQDKEEELENRKNLADKYKDTSKNEPISTFSETTFIDTPKRRQEEEKKKRDEELERKKEKKNRKKKGNKQNLEENEIGEDNEEELVVNVQQEEEKQDNQDNKENKDFGDNTELQNIFSNIYKGNKVNGSKIRSDKGIVSFVGDDNAGTSGLVANTADMYMMEKRRVLVIDLDFRNRMQTIYFKQYENMAEKQKGTTRSLIDSLIGYDIEDCAIKFTDNLSVMSIGRDEHIDDDLLDSLSGGLEAILIEAREKFDLVLIDIPKEDFSYYLDSLDEVNKNIFVVENKFYKIDNFIENYVNHLLLKNVGELENILGKSDIILNKFMRGMMDLDGNEINRKYLRAVLDKVGYPFDRIGVAGEIPFYKDWESQFFTGVRYIWEDEYALGTYRQVYDKIVI